MNLRYSVVNQKTHRLIASRFPTIGIFDDLTDNAQDLRAAFILESLTNDRLASVRINALADHDIITGAGISGSGASIVMAAFLHADREGGRFTDAKLGGWYASFEVETALAETLYHHNRKLAFSDGGFPNRIQMRELLTMFNTKLVDICGLQTKNPELYHKADYATSQAFAASLKWTLKSSPENGIVFNSVRHKSGTNICVFWPGKVPLPVTQGDHYEYHWDAKGKMSVVKLTQVTLA